MRFYSQLITVFFNHVKFLVVTLGLFASSHAQADTLTITVQNIVDRSGVIMLAVVNEAAFNEKGEPAVQAILQPINNQVVFRTDSILAGVYAVKVMHDVNENGELDTNFVGMPKEPFGFSNNARGNFGPPTFADSKFTVNGDTAIAIRME